MAPFLFQNSNDCIRQIKDDVLDIGCQFFLFGAAHVFHIDGLAEISMDFSGFDAKPLVAFEDPVCAVNEHRNDGGLGDGGRFQTSGFERIIASLRLRVPSG